MDKRIDINALNHVLDIRLKILHHLKRVFLTHYTVEISKDNINLEYLNGVPHGTDLIHRLVYVYKETDSVYRVCVHDYYTSDVQDDPTLKTVFNTDTLSELVQYLNLNTLPLGHLVLDATFTQLSNAVNEDIWIHYRDMVFLGHRDNFNNTYPYSGLKPLYPVSISDYLEYTDITIPLFSH